MFLLRRDLMILRYLREEVLPPGRGHVSPPAALDQKGKGSRPDDTADAHRTHWDGDSPPQTCFHVPGRQLFLHTHTHNHTPLNHTQTQPSHNPLRAASRGRNTFYAVSVARVINKRPKLFAIAQNPRTTHRNHNPPPPTNHIPSLSCTETLPQSRSSSQLPSGHGTNDEPPRDAPARPQVTIPRISNIPQRQLPFSVVVDSHFTCLLPNTYRARLDPRFTSRSGESKALSRNIPQRLHRTLLPCH
ncbi:hypothetical protein CSAL01_09239 [Colletotrichum salicis]|uniref:Uncharacterized protein n=1 Tax=Colletotrichum salicis TaxID=1209931 RepID=A0A135TNY0_9PEZI|nr:hypothetical protein CSAL01_09239 [Colletotrichum salicis]